MNTIIWILWILFLIVAFLFGWFCAYTTKVIEKGEKRRSWLGFVVAILGTFYMGLGVLCDSYTWKYRIYDSDEYAIVNDTTITNHNGQIDTLATFKIVKK